MTHDQRRILDLLARACAGRAWRVAYALLRDEHEAWDAVQQAFVVAARKPAAVPLDDPWPWFARVVVLEARNLRRKRRPGPTASREGEPMDRDDADPHAALARRETRSRVEAGVQALPEREREALLLVHRAGLSHAEAARAAGRSRASITRSVRRGVDRLARRLGAEPRMATEHLALLPLLDPPGGLSAATTSWTTAASAAVPSTTAAVAAGSVTLMTTKPTLLLGLGLAAAVGFLGGGATQGFGLFRGEAPAPKARDAALRVESVPGETPASSEPATLAGSPEAAEALGRLRAERDALAQRLEVQGEELARLRRSGDRSARGPTFTFGEGGKLEGVRGANWPRLADASRKVLEGLGRMRAAVEAGEPVPKDAALQIQENVERMRVYEYRTLGKLPTAAKHNGELTHPISVTNLFAALLADAGVPLTEGQVQSIEGLGLGFERDLAEVLGGPGPRVRRLVAELALKRRFMDALHGTLTDAQRAVVVDPETHAVAGLDLYDPTLLMIHTAPILAAPSPDGIVAKLESALAQKWGLDDVQRARLAPLLETWQVRIRPLLRPTAKTSLKHYSADVAQAAGEATVELVDGALRDLDLAPEVRKALEQDPSIYVPRLLASE